MKFGKIKLLIILAVIIIGIIVLFMLSNNKDNTENTNIIREQNEGSIIEKQDFSSTNNIKIDNTITKLQVEDTEILGGMRRISRK